MFNKSLTILLLVGTLTSALLGFLALSHAMAGMTDHSGCLAALAEKAFCPGVGTLASLDFHLNFLKGLAMAVILVVFFGVTLVFIRLISLKVSRLPLSFGQSPSFNFSETSFRRSLSHWLAFHINSPAFI